MVKNHRRALLISLIIIGSILLGAGIPMLLFFLWLHIPYSYEGDYPDLYTVAVNNFFGCNGYIANENPFDPEINVIETDGYGRVLFTYDEWLNDLDGTDLVACFVMQQSDGEYVSYYEEDCALIYPQPDDTMTPPDDELTALKERNNWNLPLDDAKCTQKRITTRHESAISDHEEFLETVTNTYAEQLIPESGERTIYRYSRFSTADIYGRELHYVYALSRDRYGDGLSNPASVTEYYHFAVIICPDGSHDMQTCILPVTSFLESDSVLTQLKADNDWNLPLSA